MYLLAARLKHGRCHESNEKKDGEFLESVKKQKSRRKGLEE